MAVTVRHRIRNNYVTCLVSILGIALDALESSRAVFRVKTVCKLVSVLIRHHNIGSEHRQR